MVLLKCRPYYSGDINDEQPLPPHAKRTVGSNGPGKGDDKDPKPQPSHGGVPRPYGV